MKLHSCFAVNASPSHKQSLCGCVYVCLCMCTFISVRSIDKQVFSEQETIAVSLFCISVLQADRP